MPPAQCSPYVLLQCLAQAAGCIRQHIKACSDHFEVVVAEQLQDKGNKLWHLLQEDLGLCRSKAC
jgi:hypothetical protein